MRIVIHEKESLEVRTMAEIDSAIASATAEACTKGLLNIIKLEADNGNTMYIVVGGNETVLGFGQGDGDRSNYASKGVATENGPVMTGYLSLSHHTEFPRKWVIPLKRGLLALEEFCQSGNLPTCIEWVEL